MDIKAKTEELVEKIKNDNDLQSQFAKDPIAAIEKLIGIDLPDEQIKAIADGVKAKNRKSQEASAACDFYNDEFTAPAS